MSLASALPCRVLILFARSARVQFLDEEGDGLPRHLDQVHAQDRLRTAVTPEGTTTYGHFPDGLAKSTAFFDNSTYEGRCYDPAGRLTALVTARTAVRDACAPPPFVSRYQYELDAVGGRADPRKSVEEVVKDAASVGPNALRKKGKLLPY
jgi:hypothetical protein